jgi:hypothetical protein
MSRLLPSTAQAIQTRSRLQARADPVDGLMRIDIARKGLLAPLNGKLRVRRLQSWGTPTSSLLCIKCLDDEKVWAVRGLLSGSADLCCLLKLAAFELEKLSVCRYVSFDSRMSEEVAAASPCSQDRKSSTGRRLAWRAG